MAAYKTRALMSLCLSLFISSATLSKQIDENEADDWIRGFAMCKCEGYKLNKNKKRTLGLH